MPIPIPILIPIGDIADMTKRKKDNYYTFTTAEEPLSPYLDVTEHTKDYLDLSMFVWSSRFLGGGGHFPSALKSGGMPMVCGDKVRLGVIIHEVTIRPTIALKLQGLFYIKIVYYLGRRG